MATKCFSLVRGRAMRVTRLDGCGTPVVGTDSVVVSDGFIQVALTANVDEGTTISVQNAAGKTCVLDEPCPTFTGYDVEVQFCQVDPDLYAMMTAQEVVLDGNGNSVGFGVDSDADACESGFALELWSNVPAAACEAGASEGQFGYFLIPFLRGGVLGDFTIGNDAVNFTLTGAKSRDGNAWGNGPYDVVLGPGVTSEVQTVTITGTPTGGSFRLSVSGQQTADIAYNAVAADVQTALEALSNVAPGDLTVGGGPGPAAPYTVTFAAKEDVAQISASHTFTGGTTPNIAVTTTTPGVGGTAGPLLLPLPTTRHLHMQLTSVPPPDPQCGATELAA
jgi:hypothetical protein